MGEVIDDDDGLEETMRNVSRVAVLGMKGEGPAGSVPRYMRQHGYETIPVNPYRSQVDGIDAFDSLDELDGAVDLVLVFRRSEDVPGHVDEILALDPPPRAVWLQLGIRNTAAARKLAENGIDVVQDRCFYVEHRRLIG